MPEQHPLDGYSGHFDTTNFQQMLLEFRKHYVRLLLNTTLQKLINRFISKSCYHFSPSFLCHHVMHLTMLPPCGLIHIKTPSANATGHAPQNPANHHCDHHACACETQASVRISVTIRFRTVLLLLDTAYRHIHMYKGLPRAT